MPEINERVECIDRIRTCYIMFKDYLIGELSHEYSSISGEFDWVIRIYWDTWDKLTAMKYPMNLAGIDHTLRKEEYIRAFNPNFVTQRTLSNKRPELQRFLKELHLRSNDLFEVLCRTHGICGNDDFYVSRFKDDFIDVHKKRTYDIPDFDTDCYGWLKSDGSIQGYGKMTSKTMNCSRRI